VWHLCLYVLFLIYPGMSSTVLRHYVCKQVCCRHFVRYIPHFCVPAVWCCFAVCRLSCYVCRNLQFVCLCLSTRTLQSLSDAFPDAKRDLNRPVSCQQQIDQYSFLLADLRVSCYDEKWTLFAYIDVPLVRASFSPFGLESALDVRSARPLVGLECRLPCLVDPRFVP
jgi:hypothetical protein